MIVLCCQYKISLPCPRQHARRRITAKFIVAILFSLRCVKLPRINTRPIGSCRGKNQTTIANVESPGGISPPGAPRSVREPLDSHGSRCSAVGTRGQQLYLV